MKLVRLGGVALVVSALAAGRADAQSDAGEPGGRIRTWASPLFFSPGAAPPPAVDGSSRRTPNPDRSSLAVGPGALPFVALTPCRLVDTRNASGPLGGPALAANGSRAFVLTGTCAVPAGAKVLSTNFTVVSPAAAGDLVAYPSTLGAPPTASTISFRAGTTRANNAHLLLASDGSGGVVVKNNAPGTVQVVIDVNGYYR